MSNNQQLGLHQNLQLDDPTTLEACNTVIPRYALLIGDTHFGRFSNDPKELEESANFFYHVLLPMLSHMNEEYGTENVCVIQLGDVFDNKSSVGILTNNIVIDIFKRLSKDNLVFTIVGNHDTVYKDIRSINNSKGLSLLNNAHVVDHLSEYHTASGQIIYLMPNYDVKEKLETAVSQCQPGSYLFGHDEIAGFAYEGQLIKEGKSMSASLLKNFKRVIFGHIHKSQSKENISYLGTPYQTRMNEWKNHNHVAVLDFETDEIEYYDNDYSPKYDRINIFDLMNMTLSEAKDFVSNKKVTVLCPGDSIIRIKTHKITPLLTTCVKVEYKQQYDNKETNAQVEDIIVDATVSDGNIDLEQQIDEYVSNLNSVVISKNLVQINDQLKEKIKTKLHTLYKMSK